MKLHEMQIQNVQEVIDEDKISENSSNYFQTLYSSKEDLNPQDHSQPKSNIEIEAITEPTENDSPSKIEQQIIRTSQAGKISTHNKARDKLEISKQRT